MEYYDINYYIRNVLVGTQCHFSGIFIFWLRHMSFPNPKSQFFYGLCQKKIRTLYGQDPSASSSLNQDIQGIECLPNHMTTLFKLVFILVGSMQIWKSRSADQSSPSIWEQQEFSSRNQKNQRSRWMGVFSLFLHFVYILFDYYLSVVNILIFYIVKIEILI